MAVFKRKLKGGLLSKDWYIDYYVQGRRVMKKVGPNKKLAEHILHDIKLKILRGDHLGIHEAKKITLADFAKEYLLYAKSTKAASTYAGNVPEMQRLTRSFDGYLAKLTTAQVEKYKVERSQTVSAATVNRELALLKHMLSKAVEWNYLKHNPAKPVRLLKEPPGRLRYLEAEDIERLIECCADPHAPYLRTIVVMAVHTGMRVGEILGLQWTDLDLKNRFISVAKTKSNERKTIPINDVLYAELDQLPRHVTSPYLFHHADGTRLLHIDRSFHAALKRA